MNCQTITRRDAMRQMGISAAALHLTQWLPSLAAGHPVTSRQRVIWMFSPNGTIPDAFWPKQTGIEFELPQILAPLEPWRDQILILKGIDNRIRGDGDDHMRGMSCLLTGIELFPGNIQGGSNTPAGWPRGRSIDQELRAAFQADQRTATRFGSLEFGVLVPDRADVWSRWVYAGPNQPITPLSNPRKMFEKLYGNRQRLQQLGSVLDAVQEDLKKVRQQLSAADHVQLDSHLQSIRETEVRLQSEIEADRVEPPTLSLDVRQDADQLPALSAVQQDLLVAALQSDLTRLATLQYDRSVGNLRFKFLGIQEGHHELSHDPDDKAESQTKLIQINQWYCQQLVRLVQRLAETPEPDGNGSLLDHTTVIWTNELGKGNSHTLNDIPFVLVGGGAGFRLGRSLQFKHLPHNRLWVSLAQGLGHPLESFGNEQLCKGGRVEELFG